MVDSIKITALQDIGANLAYTTLVPVVNMAGTPTTQKANLQILGNLILNGAGGSYFARAAQANIALSVANAAQPNITSVGTLTSLTVTGNANVGNVGATQGVFTSVSGSLVTTSQPNVTSVGTLTSLTVSGVSNLGAVGNVRITGGASGQKLTTDGAGNLSWTNDANSSYGNSNVVSLLSAFGSNTITTTGNISGGNLVTGGQVVASGNVSSGTGLSTGGFLSVDGTADLHDTTVTGNLSATGNITATNLSTGRVIATGNISGTQLLSNIATGTAPLVVTSTTQVANLNVATAGSATSAGTVTTNAQPNITSVGTLTAAIWAIKQAILSFRSTSVKEKEIGKAYIKWLDRLDKNDKFNKFVYYTLKNDNKLKSLKSKTKDGKFDFESFVYQKSLVKKWLTSKPAEDELEKVFRDSRRGDFLELTQLESQQVKSDLIHLLLTRKGSRYRFLDYIEL